MQEERVKIAEAKYAEAAAVNTLAEASVMLNRM